MKRDYLLSQDMRTFAQDFPDAKSASKMCRFVKRVCKDSECHVRKGHRVVVTTHFSSNSWVLTFSCILIQLKKLNIVEPDWLWKYANQCTEYARHRKTWYLITKDDERVSCKDFLYQWKDIIPINEGRL